MRSISASSRRFKVGSTRIVMASYRVLPGTAGCDAFVVNPRPGRRKDRSHLAPLLPGQATAEPLPIYSCAMKNTRFPP